MLLKFALKNVLRNTNRSLLTAVSIAVASFVAVFTSGFMSGIIKGYMNNYVKYQTGHMKIMTKEFLERERFMPVDSIIFESNKITKKLKSIKEVETVTERIRFSIILCKGDNTLPAVGMGIDIKNNQLNLKKKLIKGKMEPSGIYIGYSLAKKLGVKQGDKLLLATKTSEGGLNGIKLKIAGIFKFGMSLYDQKFFFVSLNDAKKLLKIYEGTTEIYVFLKNIKFVKKVDLEIKSFLDKQFVCRTMKEQLGNFYKQFELSVYFIFIIKFVIISLASFVVINTMMMSVFERLREIGMLKAIGMTKRDIFINFTLEGGIIGAIGGFIGCFIGYILLSYFSANGLNMGHLFKEIDMPFEYILYPTSNIVELFSAITMSIAIPAIASLYPAYYANSLTPSEALRKK